MERVAEFMPWGSHAMIEETYEFIERIERRWKERERVTYAIRPREGEPGAGEFTGNATLGLDWRRRTGKLGVWLRKPFWGWGYSSERARCSNSRSTRWISRSWRSPATLTTRTHADR